MYVNSRGGIMRASNELTFCLYVHVPRCENNLQEFSADRENTWVDLRSPGEVIFLVYFSILWDMLPKLNNGTKT